MQVIFKPHALKTLLGINASALTDGLAELHEFSAEDLNIQLIEANNEQERITLLTNFLLAKFKQAKTRDTLVEESLRFIHKNIGSIHVKYLKAFSGITPKSLSQKVDDFHHDQAGYSYV